MFVPASAVQLDPPSSLMNRLEVPTDATPTKMRGVACKTGVRLSSRYVDYIGMTLPDAPEVESKVTKETPIGSLLYPDVSVESGSYVPVLDRLETLIHD